MVVLKISYGVLVIRDELLCELEMTEDIQCNLNESGKGHSQYSKF